MPWSEWRTFHSRHFTHERMFTEDDPVLPAQCSELPEEQTPRERHDCLRGEGWARAYKPRGRSFREYAAAEISICICALQSTGDAAA
jgi:hypothetical protein